MQQSPEDALQRWSPEQPLSEAELELLAQFESEGTRIAGLELQRREDGRSYIDVYQPPKKEQGLKASGLSVDQLNARGEAQYRQGRHPMAAAAASLALRLHTLKNGPEHPATLTTASNLASILRAQGDLASARGIQESVVEMLRQVLGANHPATLSSANNLALTRHAQGDFDGARRMQEVVLEILKKELGAEHPHSLVTAGNLGETLRAQGDLSAAGKIQTSVFETLRCVLGPEHPNTLSSANNLALTLHAQGDWNGARRIQEWEYETRRRVLGAEHPTTVTSANNLALTFHAQGDFASARRIQESAFETHQRTLGAEHPTTLTSASNLALTLLSQGDLSVARRVQESVHEVRQRVLGVEHPDTLISASGLAETLRALGELADARKIHELVYQTRQRVLGADHPSTLISANNLAATLSTQGDLVGASRINETVYVTRRRVLGAEHPDTMISANNLAEELRAAGHLVGARNLQEAVLETRRRVFGAEHPATLSAASNLASTLWALGELGASAQCCLTALQGLITAPCIDSAALLNATGLPLLADPGLAWSSSAMAALLEEILPALSKNAQAQLLCVPVDLSEPLYQALQAMHERWAVVAWYRLPEPERIDALLAIAAPLHGVHSWSEIGQEAVVTALYSTTQVSPNAQKYVMALQTSQELRQRVNAALQHRAQFSQRSTDLQHRLMRIRLGEGDEAEQALADATLVPRLQDAWEASRREAEAARHDLDTASTQSFAANTALQQAQQTLAGSDPALQGLWSPVSTTEAVIQATLADDELWLLSLPGSMITSDTKKLDEEAADAPSFLLALRRDRPGQVVRTAPFAHLAMFSHLCRGQTRVTLRGLLRDGNPGPEPDAKQHTGGNPGSINRTSPIERLQRVNEVGFWAPLAPLLQGVRRIHLVTAAGSHDLIFEPGRPAEHNAVVLNRYCGLPAYLRRAGREHAAEPQAALIKPASTDTAPRYSWIYDEGWDSGEPILLTPLDSFILRHRGLGVQQTAQELHEHGPAGQVLMISSHGQMAGSATSRGGRLVIGGEHLSPLQLRRRSGGPYGAPGGGLRGLIALSCFGGVVGNTGLGDALGTISALQASGLHWAIACLAPVADFYTPLFSALLLHQLETQEDPSWALERAKRLLTQGPWDDALCSNLMEPLRQEYRLRMLEVLRQAVDPEADPHRSERIMNTVQGWSLSGSARKAVEARGLAGAMPRHAQSQESFVDDCLDVLLRKPHERDATDANEDGPAIRALEHLSAVTVFFGRG